MIDIAWITAYFLFNSLTVLGYCFVAVRSVAYMVRMAGNSRNILRLPDFGIKEKLVIQQGERLKLSIKYLRSSVVLTVIYALTLTNAVAETAWTAINDNGSWLILAMFVIGNAASLEFIWSAQKTLQYFTDEEQVDCQPFLPIRNIDTCLSNKRG